MAHYMLIAAYTGMITVSIALVRGVGIIERDKICVLIG